MTTNPIVITTESSSDLSAGLVEKYGVGVIPMHVTLDDVQYLDGVNINIHDIFNVYDEKKIIPTTSAISIVEYIEFFKKYTDQGITVIHISLSSKISATYQNACLAAQDIGNIFVLDSLSLSLGVAQLIIKAVQMVKAGLSAQEIVEAILALIKKLDTSFVIASLDFLRKGGRCSGLTALGANILGIKPCIQMVDGAMEVVKKYRGKTEAAYLSYIADKLDAQEEIDFERLLIAYSGLSDATIDSYRKHIKKISKFKEIIFENVGCTIASHSGKVVIGLFLLRT